MFLFYTLHDTNVLCTFVVVVDAQGWIGFFTQCILEVALAMPI